MKTVMLVDDNMINNFIMKQVISNVDEGLQIKDYTDSQKALQLLNEADPAIIILDLNMPGMNGWQFLDNMSAKQLDYQAYILTSSTSDLDRQSPDEYRNVAGYLNKPITPAIVVSILKAE